MTKEYGGNLKLVMEIMGQKDVKTAMKYQHPEHELVRAVLNRSNGTATPGQTQTSQGTLHDTPAI